MGIRKSTRVENYRMIHTWTDENFLAEVYKDSHSWFVTVNGLSHGAYARYQRAVDIVMDEWRLTKAGFDSWEDAAREMAEGDWDDLSDFEKQDLVDAARLMARGM